MEIISVVKPLVFYFFSTIAVLSAVMVVVQRNPLYSAVNLVLTFFSLSAIYVLLQSEIIAVLQVLVYAGAIMVLVIFVIMLLNLRENLVKFSPGRKIKTTISVALMTLLFVIMSVLFSKGALTFLATAKKGTVNVEAIKEAGAFQLFSQSLFSEYLLPFELVSLLLTAAIVGVIILVRGMQVVKPQNARREEK
jgi:NADH-quinone oxidoreductase subunit J